MSLYETLSKNQAKTHFLESDEMAFYLANRGVLAGLDVFEKYLRVNDPFLVVRANIIIRALINKRTIERLYYNKIKPPKKEEEVAEMESQTLEDYMRSGLSELPYLNSQDQKIYVPVFPRSLNLLYSQNFTKLSLAPYKSLLAQFESLMIDPFDYYGSALYDSYFTKLVVIKRENNLLACYDFDAQNLYFINSQGRVDVTLALFDKDLKNPSSTHLVGRLTNLCNTFFLGDKRQIIMSLLQNGFVSESLIHKVGVIDTKTLLKNAPKEEKISKDQIP